MKFPFASSSRDFLISIKRNPTRGATMVETSLGLGLFLFLIFCLFSILWMSYHFVVAQYLATEATRQLVVLRRADAAVAGGREAAIRAALCGNDNGITALARLDGQGYLMNFNNPGVGGCAPGVGSAVEIACISSDCCTTAGDNAGCAGDFVSVRIIVRPGFLALVNGGGDIASIAGGNQALTFSQSKDSFGNELRFSGIAIGRNEPVIEQ